MFNNWRLFCVVLVAYFVPFGYDICLFLAIDDAFGVANAASPDCTPYAAGPGHYTSFQMEATILSSGACPSGYTDVGEVESCFVDGGPGCFQYAPVAMTYTDSSGAYEFADICPLDPSAELEDCSSS